MHKKAGNIFRWLKHPDADLSIWSQTPNSHELINNLNKQTIFVHNTFAKIEIEINYACPKANLFIEGFCQVIINLIKTLCVQVLIA